MVQLDGPDAADKPRRQDLLLLVIRCVFVLIVAGTAARVVNDLRLDPRLANATWIPVLTFALIMSAGGLALVLDIIYPRKRISSISAIFFGLIVGSILGYFLKLAFAPTLSIWFKEDMISWFSVLLTAIFCYVCVSILLQTKNDFRFVIPYVEFAPQRKGSRPLVLDSHVIIDGRIADIAESGLLDQAIVISTSVLEDVQAIADGQDKIRRKRGLRGLEVVDRLKRIPELDVDILSDDNIEGIDRQADSATRLVLFCKHIAGRLLTNDIALAKAAQIHSVATINLNAVANALKPPALWGDRIAVTIVKEGESTGQGVGYLDDGTMVVVEMGRRFLGKEVNLIVESFLQTSAGRMVFGRIDSKNPSPTHAAS